jgi:CRISPR/Cas system-associated exonuclease Cas4 (RecB family)
MRAKLSIETTGVRGTLIFEGETAEVGKQLRKLIDLLAPVGAEGGEPQAPAPTSPASSAPTEGDGAGAEGGESQAPVPTSPASSVPTEGDEAGAEDKGQLQHEDMPLNGVHSPNEAAKTHLSFSTLALLFRCAHAFHLRQAGIKPPPAEDQKIGTDFRTGIAAFLRGQEIAFEYPQNEGRFGYIRELLSALRRAPDLAVEPREKLEAGGVVWVGYADAIANGAIYEFKATKRLPTVPSDAHALQASVYAAMFGAEKAKIVYVSEKAAREFDVAPFAGVREFLADMADQIKAGVPNIPTGLTHPWGCDRCEYRAYCRFYDFVRGNGVTEIPF